MPLRSEVIDHIGQCGFMPTVVIPQPEAAPQVAQALLDGGIDIIEVLNRVDFSTTIQAVQMISTAGLPILVGVGTLVFHHSQPLKTDHLLRLRDAGARFFVSPIAQQALLELACTCPDIPFFHGATTHGEVGQIVQYDDRTPIKIYPMESLADGVAHLKHLGDIFPGLKFIVSGGINEKRRNLGTYLELPSVYAIAAGHIAPRDAIEAGRFGDITANTKRAVSVRKEVRGT